MKTKVKNKLIVFSKLKTLNLNELNKINGGKTTNVGNSIVDDLNGLIR